MKKIAREVADRIAKRRKEDASAPPLPFEAHREAALNESNVEAVRDEVRSEACRELAYRSNATQRKKRLKRSRDAAHVGTLF